MTKRSQRVGIWIIAIVMGVGSLGLYFVAILANQNSTKDKASLQQDYATYQAAVTNQSDALSTKYFSTLNQYVGEVAPFDASSVTALATNDLKDGDGETITASTTYSAYYIGWNPSGKVFDESISSGKLKPPIPSSGLIEGWTKGMVGAKIGGVRELTIPSAQAYGATGSGAAIPPNTPIKFIVLAIPTPPAIPVPASLQQAAATRQ